MLMIRHCYRYLTEDWQHADRLPVPDDGFEEKFRDSCVLKLRDWVISQYRELNLGSGLLTASGVLHEIDGVIHNEPFRAILELKNRNHEKNDVIVFFSKIADYLCYNTGILKQTIIPIFMSTCAFEYTGLAACIGLGIHPMAPGLRPVPLLISNALAMQAELDRGVVLNEEEKIAYEDYCVELSAFNQAINPAGMNERFDLLNDETLTIKTVRLDSETVHLGDQLRTLNAECTDLIGVFREAVRRTFPQ